jgi:hypothetical protein
MYNKCENGSSPFFPKVPLFGITKLLCPTRNVSLILQIGNKYLQFFLRNCRNIEEKRFVRRKH